jgi:type I restriction enzyme S subunit
MAKGSQNKDTAVAYEHALKSIGKTRPCNGIFHKGYPGGEMIDSELGEIPKGWEIRKLSDIIQITGGGTPKRSIEAYWNGDIPWFSIQDISTHPIIIETKEKITSEGLRNSSTKVLPKGTTIITARGTVGKLAFLGEEMTMNQSCYGINGKQGIGPFFNFFILKEAVEILKRNSHGAVFDTITTGTFDTVNVATGPIQTIKLFDKTIEAFFEKIESLVRENRVLIGLRDTLLPKLISGELEVNESLLEPTF